MSNIDFSHKKTNIWTWSWVIKENERRFWDSQLTAIPSEFLSAIVPQSTKNYTQKQSAINLKSIKPTNYVLEPRGKRNSSGGKWDRQKNGFEPQTDYLIIT